eukprot:CAMPEP_0118862950 /NCGR_PEP_ID=MMETSP1163-20130328/7997_1 /TAXON_ID=124430 /ORGANISM="Phaeomonas parva, Strain CCMP2877" /LENGTH=36 /DNA_ID= /DNA_START= /DNA_END= /DNA_ORIENTATION=
MVAPGARAAATLAGRAAPRDGASARGVGLGFGLRVG